MKRILVTSALPYANGYSHLGHLAGSFLPADLYVRFMRLTGMPVLYVCGSDENGAAIAITADQEGSSPRAVVDKYHKANKEALERFAMSFDVYSRTSNPKHAETAREFFADFMRKGLLVEQEEEQFYDPVAQKFLPDRFVEGTCPNCGFDHARSDECDNCLSKYEPLELRNPVSKVSGAKPVLKASKHLYFRFGHFQEFLENFIKSHEGEWKDNVIQQSYSWLNMGLANRPITRDLDWGIAVPAEGYEDKVIYVWFDALLGYITATREWAEAQGRADSWQEWWQNPDTSYIAFLGKDNIWFHTLMFPAMLHARGDYILPSNVPANEFLNLEGRKFSKSRNWGIDLRDYLADFPADSDVDAMRYVLAAIIPESKDSDFTWKDYQARVNNELVAKLGNFVNRTAQFIHKYYNGMVPTLPASYQSLPQEWQDLVTYLAAHPAATAETVQERFVTDSSSLGMHELRFVSSLFRGARTIADRYKNFRIREAVMESMRLAEAANKYFNDTEPWRTRKNDADAAARTLFVCAQAVRALGIAFAPIVPSAAAKMLAMVDTTTDGDAWTTLTQPRVKAGTGIPKPELLFVKIEDNVIDEQIAKLLQKSKEAEEAISYEPLPAETGIETFEQIGLRTGTIVEADNIKKANRLLRLVVDLGFEKRQIVAGIAKYYSPEELIGRRVIVVANLKPATLRGVESQGMVLCASKADGSMVLVAPEDSGVPDGMEVR